MSPSPSRKQGRSCFNAGKLECSNGDKLSLYEAGLALIGQWNIHILESALRYRAAQHNDGVLFPHRAVSRIQIDNERSL